MRIALLMTAALALAAPSAGFAKDHGHGHKGGKGHPHGMPPGQAKKMWRQGERLPRTYITERYYVAYPSRYDLGPTPYGYRWMRVGDEYYLAQTETGLISQVISALVR